MMKLAAVLGALAVAANAAPVARRQWRQLSADEKQSYTYADFVAEHGKESTQHGQEVFNANLAKIHAHNAQNLTWTAGVNQFTDMTQSEFKSFYQGYVANMPVDGSTATQDILTATPATVPSSVDWRTASSPKGGPVLTPVKNQGGCGSCWAFSATESIEADIAIETGKLPVLAPQEFVDCVPNPEQCGGTGGCQGATAELAFNYTMSKGQISAEEYKYTGMTGQCKLDKLPKTTAGIKNFVKLPINEYAPLLAAVAKQPISISVDASKWQMYEGGVFTGCPVAKTETVDIDHAVQLVGYGGGTQDAGLPYFIVRNSWSAAWGEKGFIRIDRTSSIAGTCYEDPTPGDGNGCKGGPSKMTVCGACGILSDSSYPTGGFTK